MSGAAALLSRLEHFGIKLGLDATRRILAALGDPQTRFPSVLIAGTNGKGSTAALLQSMLRAAAYRTGLYTSPHLESPHERIRVDGRAIGDAPLADYLAQAIAASERHNHTEPTYFEAVTAAGFAHFAAEGVDLAVVEVGMGGRLDATNTAAPLLSLITPIALDHREYLGDTLAAIASEKAGILRPGVPALSAAQEPEAAQALIDAARAAGTPLRNSAARARAERVTARSWAPQDVELALDGARLVCSLPLLGPHQPQNLALAAAAAANLRDQGFARLDGEAIARGAATCRWPGRLEPIALPNGRRVVLDGAHNPAGVEALVAFLRGAGERVDLLFGALADKDAAAMLPPLAELAEEITLTAPPSPRALDPRDLALLAPGRAMHLEADANAALGWAVEHGDRARPLLVCGSLYLIGDLRRELRSRFGVPRALDEI